MISQNFQLADYSRLRGKLTELHQNVLKLQIRNDILTCARHLGLLHKKELYFNNEYEITVLADYRVYSYRPNGINLAELYLRLNRSVLEDSQIDLLTRMSVARYSFLHVDVVEGHGVLQVTDVLSEKSFALVDNGLSLSLQPKQAIAAHFIDMGDFHIQSGGVLSIDRQLASTKEVEHALFLAVSKFGKKLTHFTPAASAKLARATISAAIRLGYTDSCQSIAVA